jgi:hypothetical protein
LPLPGRCLRILLTRSAMPLALLLRWLLMVLVLVVV